MHFGNSAGNFGESALRRPVGHDSAVAMSKLVALLSNYMQIVQNWSEKGVFHANQQHNLHYIQLAQATPHNQTGDYLGLSQTQSSKT